MQQEMPEPWCRSHRKWPGGPSIKPKLAEHPLSRPVLLGRVIYISSLKANMGRTRLALISYFKSSR